MGKVGTFMADPSALVVDWHPSGAFSTSSRLLTIELGDVLELNASAVPWPVATQVRLDKIEDWGADKGGWHVHYTWWAEGKPLVRWGTRAGIPVTGIMQAQEMLDAWLGVWVSS